jgi:hypothetical protein
MAFDTAYEIFQQIGALTQEINTELNQRPVEPTTVANDIAWRRAPKGAPEVGQEAVFTLSTWGNRAEKRSPYEELPGTKPEVCVFSVVHDEWAPKAEIIPRGTQLTDIYGLFKENLPMIVQQSQLEYDAQLADLLGNGQTGTTRYDLLPYFTNSSGSGSHQANPNRPGLKTFDNYATSATLNRANIIVGLNALASVPGFNGLPLSMPGKIVIVVGTKDQEFRARVELQAALNAAASGTATQSNVMPIVSGPADVVMLPNLQNYDSGKGWYMFKIVSDKHRPMVLSLAEPWQVFTEGLGDPNAHSRVLRNVAKYGVRAFFGFGFLWPHLGYKFVEP